MELVTVTKDIAIRAILAGVCKVPKIGQLIKDFSSSELSWAERLFSLKELKAFMLPIWTLSGSGYGSGYGDGSGYGYGYGDGSGYGYGYGDGYGSGDGSGYGYGYGDGKDFASKILALEA